MLTELKTPFEIIDELVENIENRRKHQKIRQKDLAQMSGVSLSSYQKFLYDKTISLTSLIKIMYALDMMKNLDGLVKKEKPLTLDDIRAKQKQKALPQRVRVKDET